MNGLLRESPFEIRSARRGLGWAQDREEGSIKMPEVTYISLIVHTITFPYPLEYFISPSILFFLNVQF